MYYVCFCVGNCVVVVVYEWECFIVEVDVLVYFLYDFVVFWVDYCECCLVIGDGCELYFYVGLFGL